MNPAAMTEVYNQDPEKVKLNAVSDMSKALCRCVRPDDAYRDGDLEYGPPDSSQSRDTTLPLALLPLLQSLI